MTTTPKLCGTCKHIDSTKTTARELWVACKLTGKRTALFTATCERWEEKERKWHGLNQNRC